MTKVFFQLDTKGNPTKTAPKYSIDTDIGLDYADSGPWRSYNLVADGDSATELYNNAYIVEIDQDGGELNQYDIGELPYKGFEYCLDLIEELTGYRICDTCEDGLLRADYDKQDGQCLNCKERLKKD